MVLSQKWIAEQKDMIDPFMDKMVHRNSIAYGVTGCCYTARLSNEFLFPIDGKSSVKKTTVLGIEHEVIKYTNAFALPNKVIMCKTFEKITVPKGIVVFLSPKSAYTTKGLIIQAQPLYPGFSDNIVFSVINPTDQIIELAPGQGILQLFFVELDNKKLDFSGIDMEGSYPVNATDAPASFV